MMMSGCLMFSMGCLGNGTKHPAGRKGGGGELGSVAGGVCTQRLVPGASAPSVHTGAAALIVGWELLLYLWLSGM